jgi:hypothetical protein
MASVFFYEQFRKILMLVPGEVEVVQTPTSIYAT